MRILSALMLIFIFAVLPVYGQGKVKGIDTLSKEYPFIVIDSPSSFFTMKQFNQNYLSLYRISVNELNKTFSTKTSLLVQIGLSLITMPLTHEEGHRSVLTVNNIGSVSRPFFDKTLTAIVKGVSHQSLIDLRNNDLPSYIRLHTAGLESDYHLLLSEASLLNWSKEGYDVLRVEYLMRKISLVSYYFTGALGEDIKIKEPEDELKRNIVGHGIYGAIRHLHRPDMPFYRYTRTKDLTNEEKRYAKRVGWLSLLNLVDPLIFGKDGWELKGGYKVNGGLGYGMGPFGEFLDEHIWLKGSCFNTYTYFRQYKNKEKWFPAMGITIDDLYLGRRVKSIFALHGWSQPKGLDFNTSSARWGGGVDGKLQSSCGKIVSK